MATCDFRGHAVEEAHRTQSAHRLVVARPGRTTWLDPVSVQATAGHYAPAALVLPRTVPQDHERHRVHRE